ncbi:hypothetical protein D3C75_834240 [compost metagenome]
MINSQIHQVINKVAFHLLLEQPAQVRHAHAQFVGQQIQRQVGSTEILVNIVQHLDDQIAFLPFAAFCPNQIHVLPKHGQEETFHLIQTVVLIQGISHFLQHTELLRLDARFPCHYGSLHQTLQIQLANHLRRHSVVGEGLEPAIRLRLQLLPVQKLQ